MKYFFKILITPSCWIRNYAYNEYLDKFILEAIKNGKVTKSDDPYYCVVSGVKLWTANYPYAYGSPVSDNVGNSRLPSRTTVFKLHEIVGKRAEYSIFRSMEASRIK